ncbi:MAG: Zn-dependent hydrolase [Granulosicoccaceae bacterium]
MPFRIDKERLWNRLMSLGELGGTPKGGCCRLALTDLDRQARDLFIGWCKDLGCEISVDQIGNIFARKAGSGENTAAVATGSHLDTQPTGGKFDGILGCLAGLEALESMRDHSLQAEHPIELCVWTNEEGARFAPAMLASGVYSGKFSLDYGLSQEDRDGISVGAALDAIGYRGEQAVGAREHREFYELHIEQGPVLENQELEIGVVSGVLGMRWYDLTLNGTPAHAGPTPMAYRRDALYAASKITTALYELALAHADGDARFTSGELHIDKCSRNVIPGELHMTIDLRHADQAGLQQLEVETRAIIKEVSQDTGVEAELTRIWDSPPRAFNSDCVAAVKAACERTGLSHQLMISGAGHDAVNISTVTPTAMIFIPSVGGISHNESEYSTPQQVANGAQTLFELICERAGAKPTHV